MEKINKTILTSERFKVNALDFVPTESNSRLAIFSHGYSSHKGSILTWGQRLCDAGLRVIIFDLPGHYLGSYNEVESFEDFKSHAHELFQLSLESTQQNFEKIALGGHSLGGLLAIKAASLPCFQSLDKIHLVGVGVGDGLKNKNHLFHTQLFASALKLRAQLVSTHLGPEIVFPWIKEFKEELKLPSNAQTHLIVGKDDLVIPKEGAESFFERMKNLNPNTSLQCPNALAHHKPENAAGLLKAYLKSIDLI
ncbi:alpha/beta fold hydrolase [bacterium]|nr:alpha/beta fold hydrolase [bacterium]